MFDFKQDKPYILDEFARPNFDPSTGESPALLASKMRRWFCENQDLPPVIKRAESFRWLLRNAQIEVNPHTPFADKINLGIDYSGWAGTSFYEDIYKKSYREGFAERIPAVWAQRTNLALSGVSVPDNDYWHTVPDWKNVVSLGLVGLKERAERLLSSASGQRSDFYKAVVICYEAIFEYMERLISLAEKVGNVVFAGCLKNLTKRPPETLYEVMELSLLFMSMEEIGIERCRSLGNIDILYYPFYEKGITDGSLTEEKVKQLLRYFITKINAGKRYAEQPLCIGGFDEKGDTAVTRFTELFIDVYCELGVYNPKIHVRYNEKFPDSMLKRLVKAIRDGSSSMVILSDESVMSAYEKIGVNREISKNYLPQGCYEPVIAEQEDARICGAWINLAKAVELAVHGGFDGITQNVMFGLSNPEPESFEEFYRVFKDYLKSFIDATLSNIEAQESAGRDLYPSPLLSSTFNACMENGRDIFDRGMNMRNSSVKVIAIGTAVDSLLAVKQMVYEQKRLSLRDFSQILQSNWKGESVLRTEIKNSPRKWGNGNDEADTLGKDIFAYCEKLIVGRDNNYGGVYRLGADSVAMNDGYGEHTGATPDGRGAWQSLSKNLRPSNGQDREGILGFMNSMLKVDQSAFANGVPLDFMVHPSAVSGEKGLEVFTQIIKTYFEQGGGAIHGNVVSAEKLIDAQKHPEKYKNLQIRVCGWNEFFVNMSKKMQDEFITRAKGVER